jgi:channel protein (hemolysin III family)
LRPVPGVDVVLSAVTTIINTQAIPGFREPIACWSHLLAAGLFAVLAVPMVRRGRGDPWRVGALVVYSFSAVLLLSISGTYHLLAEGTARTVLQRLDHAAIFVLIAGTFTPPHMILFRGPMRWGMLLLIWTAGVTGLTLKTIFFDQMAQREWLGILFYLVMGWAGALSGAVAARRYGPWLVMPLLWGAVMYTIGAVIEWRQTPTIVPGVIGPHELFHFAIIVAALLHWKFIWRFADGHIPVRSGPPIANPE